MATELARRGWRVDALSLARGDAPGAEAPYDLMAGVRVWPVVEPEWPQTPGRLLARISKARLGMRRPNPTPTPAAARPESVVVWSPGVRMGAKFELLTDLAAAQNWAARAVWCARVRRLGRVLAAERRYRCVVVSSPPHVTQLAGYWLARDTGLPLVSDFRDPWILGHPEIRIEGRLDRTLGRVFEPRVMRQAHTIVLNTPRMAAAAAALPATAGRSLTAIPNGYDRMESVSAPDPARFRIVHCGNLYRFMDPRPLFAACARLRARQALPDDRFGLDFVGTPDAYGPVSLTALARAYGLSEVFSLRSRQSREEALRTQAAAAVLVAFDSPYPYVVPMKFYDHAQMRGSMLLLGWPDGALADAAAQISIPVCRPDDDAAIDQVLDGALARWRAGAFADPIDTAGVFDRRHQVDRLEDTLLRIDASADGAARTSP
jgi:hypothetical protein